MATTIGELTTTWEVWTTASGLPHISADELICETDKNDEYITTIEQRKFIQDFIDLWEKTESATNG